MNRSNKYICPYRFCSRHWFKSVITEDSSRFGGKSTGITLGTVRRLLEESKEIDFSVRLFANFRSLSATARYTMMVMLIEDLSSILNIDLGILVKSMSEAIDDRYQEEE